MPKRGSGRRFSRRSVMRAGMGAGAAWLVPKLPAVIPVARAASAHDHQPVVVDRIRKDFTPGAPFVEPEVRRSANGALNTMLRMRYAYKDIGGFRLYMRMYEGTVPGPTLRVKPGDVLRIKLINDMPPNRDSPPEDHALPHDFNTTNLHSHGLHVSPSGISDNVMRIMEPGESYDVEIAIPSDHVPGTNWYHPHAHGSADVQIASGALGALIIEGDFADVPEIVAAKERLLVLTEAVFDSFGTGGGLSRRSFPETRGPLHCRQWRTGTDHHHAAWRGAALAHSARAAGRTTCSWTWKATN